jgi:hypothetical protein
MWGGVLSRSLRSMQTSPTIKPQPFLSWYFKFGLVYFGLPVFAV